MSAVYKIKLGNTINLASDITAANVSIVDAGGYFTSDNVEGAEQEIGASLASQGASISANTSNISTNTSNIATNTTAIATKFDTAGTNLDSSGTTVSLEAEIDSTQYDTTYQTLTYGASIAWDMSSGQAAKVTLTGAATISNPTNKNSISPILEVTQDGAGGHALSFDTDFVEVNTDNVTTGANTVTIYVFIKDSAGNFRGRGQTYST